MVATGRVAAPRRTRLPGVVRQDGCEVASQAERGRVRRDRHGESIRVTHAMMARSQIVDRPIPSRPRVRAWIAARARSTRP